MIVKACHFQTEGHAFFMPAFMSAFLSSFMLAGIENPSPNLQI